MTLRRRGLTAGDLLQWHPHLHLLTTDGGFAPDGSFLPGEWTLVVLTEA